jgi:hypothetical protein
MENNKSVTAIEWLVEEANLLENNGWIITLINQAKEMEKQQKEVDYQSGYLDCYTKLMSENLTRKI